MLRVIFCLPLSVNRKVAVLLSLADRRCFAVQTLHHIEGKIPPKGQRNKYKSVVGHWLIFNVCH